MGETQSSPKRWAKHCKGQGAGRSQCCLPHAVKRWQAHFHRKSAERARPATGMAPPRCLRGEALLSTALSPLSLSPSALVAGAAGEAPKENHRGMGEKLSPLTDVTPVYIPQLHSSAQAHRGQRALQGAMGLGQTERYRGGIPRAPASRAPRPPPLWGAAGGGGVGQTGLREPAS